VRVTEAIDGVPCDRGGMSMYLPNPVVHPAAADAVEFIELPSMAGDGRAGTAPWIERRDRRTAHLGSQARLDLTRAAFDYITELVASHSGDGEDVRSIIYDLHDQISVIGHPGAS
jgi:hypothetical protein